MSFVQPVSGVHDTEGQRNVISKDFMPTDWLSKISKKVQQSHLSAKKRLKTVGTITLSTKIGNLHTSAMLTVVEDFAINVLLGTAFIDEHILALRSDEQKVTAQKITPVSIVSQSEMYTYAVFAEKYAECGHNDSF